MPASVRPPTPTISSSSGLLEICQSSGSLLSGTIGPINPGQAISLPFTAQATGSGGVINRASISAADQPAPDSTAGNGANKGEDDEAQTDLLILTP